MDYKIAKSISNRKTRQKIKDMKERAKKNDIAKKLFKKYNIPIEKIDDVVVKIKDDLDVSAKTKNCKVYINSKFIDDDDEMDAYFLHELTHFCQQSTDSLEEKEMKKDYLENKHELEAFENQIEYKKEEEGQKEAERYVNQVLDHHKLRGKKRKRKFRELIATEDNS